QAANSTTHWYPFMSRRVRAGAVVSIPLVRMCSFYTWQHGQVNRSLRRRTGPDTFSVPVHVKPPYTRSRETRGPGRYCRCWAACPIVWAVDAQLPSRDAGARLQYDGFCRCEPGSDKCERDLHAL